jgi:hypothetical protein
VSEIFTTSKVILSDKRPQETYTVREKIKRAKVLELISKNTIGVGPN